MWNHWTGFNLTLPADFTCSGQCSQHKKLHRTKCGQGVVKLHNTQRNRSQRLACTPELTRSLTVCPLAILASMRFVCCTYHCFGLDFFFLLTISKKKAPGYTLKKCALVGGGGEQGGGGEESVCPMDWTHHSYNYPPPFGLKVSSHPWSIQFILNTTQLIHASHFSYQKCTWQVTECPFKWS